MVTLIREHRTKHRVASSRDLSASLKKVWKAKITPQYCLKISKHIRKNMLAVVARKGGLFYKDMVYRLWVCRRVEKSPLGIVPEFGSFLL